MRKSIWMAAATVGVGALILALVPSADASSIVGSKHDFGSGTGPNTTFNGGSDQTCVYCHTPHNALIAAPLWNHQATSSTFTVYSSPTMDSTVGQPTGISKMCLACHDGTIATDGYGTQTPTASKRITTGAALLGTDLSNDHPVSMAYGAGGGTTGMVAKATVLSSALPLYGASGSETVECASCHNPHDNANTKFLRISNAASALCLTCHNK